MTITDNSSSPKESCYIYNPADFEGRVKKQCKAALNKFRKLTRSFVLFQMLFALIGLVELVCFLLFFPFFSASSLLAISLGTLFLTFFSYLVLLFYYQAKKPEQFLQLRSWYLNACHEFVPFKEQGFEYHLSLAHAIYQLVNYLGHQEYYFYKFPHHFDTLSSLIKKFSAWCHWKDTHNMKELLLFAAIEENIHLVKTEPTDLEAHASLAHAYLALSKIYREPEEAEEGLPWTSPAYDSEEMVHKFQTAALRAVEEFKILKDYLSNDPWVHAQLAGIYHDLEMFEEETAAYEAILEVSPQDKDVLFRLGRLYFLQGFNAKGLKIYEKLKKAKVKQAEELLGFYDAYSLQEYFSAL